MEIYSTEEQQVEAIKSFWKENGNAVILGVVLGLGGLYGWKYFSNLKVEKAQAAAVAYDDLTKKMGEKDADLVALASQLNAQHGDTAYPLLAALIAAKHAVDNNDLATAKTELSNALALTKDPVFTATIQLRLARLELALNNVDAALAIVNGTFPDAFKATQHEIKGDALLAKGDKAQARVAYQVAVDASGTNINNNLQLKLDDLATATPAV